MPDILLIQPPIRDFYLTAKRTIPYGLACIAPQLIKSGFSVKILDGIEEYLIRHNIASVTELIGALQTEDNKPLFTST